MPGVLQLRPLSRGPPVTAQRAALMKDLAKLDAELAHPRAVAGARMVCTSIQSGASDEELKSTVTEAFHMGGRSLTPEQAGRVLAVIKANGFCTPS